MAATTFSIRMDEHDRQRFEQIVNEMGLTMTAAFNVFAKATIRSQSIPFPLALDPLADPFIQAKVVQELDRRLELERDPGTRHLSLEESKRELGG